MAIGMISRKTLLFGFLLSSAAYVASLHMLPYTGSFLVKSLPIFILTFIASKAISKTTGKLLIAALLLSAAGDIALALKDGKYFVTGLGLFLLAHVCYIPAFLLEAKLTRLKSPTVVVTTFLLIAYSLTISSLLEPNLGSLQIPVFLYITVITSMGIASAVRSFDLVFLGAIFFIASDSMIAINGFFRPIVGAKYWIMLTYYIAQFLITEGLVDQFDNKS
ncbi:MAG: lysoplasmalogenase [Blastocatellia bacterium]|nr:lysoplasmalogenase [Blastocatellia bacterium]